MKSILKAIVSRGSLFRIKFSESEESNWWNKHQIWPSTVIQSRGEKKNHPKNKKPRSLQTAICKSRELAEIIDLETSQLIEIPQASEEKGLL